MLFVWEDVLALMVIINLDVPHPVGVFITAARPAGGVPKCVLTISGLVDLHL